MEGLVNDLQQGDYALLLYFISGIAIGWFIVMILLPTNEEAFQNQANNSNMEAVASDGGNNANAKTSIASWEGENIPLEELERIRKRFRLTPHQMTRVMEQSKEQSTLQAGNSGSKSITTPHQTLNRLMYLCMFMVLGYILNRDYGNILIVWLFQFFPKEAKLLGLGKEKQS